MTALGRVAAPAVLVLGLWLATPVVATTPPSAAPSDSTPLSQPTVAVTPTPPATPTPPGDPGPAPTPTPMSTAGDSGRSDSCGVLDILVDPVSWTNCVFNQALVFVLQLVTDSIRGVVDSSMNVVSRTPPEQSYANPTVVALWGLMRTVASAALALVALWGGFNLMAREHLGAPYHEALELLPRLALGLLLANTSLWWGSLLIDANNALCAALGDAVLPGWEATDS